MRKITLALVFGGFPAVGARYGVPDVGLKGFGEISACVRDIMVQPKVGSQQRLSAKTTMQLRRAGTTWIIESQQ